MANATHEYAMQSFLRQSAHQVLDRRHTLSTERWDLERRFVVLTDNDLLETGAESEREQPEEEGPAMSSLLDSITTMCVCVPMRSRPTPKFTRSARRTKKRRVYPVEGFSQTPLNAKHVVKKRLSALQTDHFFRPVSEDDLLSVWHHSARLDASLLLKYMIKLKTMSLVIARCSQSRY